MSGNPLDWPVSGAIDLKVHDLPHRSASTEWWYLNTHIDTVDGRKLSVFAAFFRIVKGRNEATKEVEYAHSLTWAISDADAGHYYPESRLDPSAPKMGLERIKNGRGSRDKRLNRALTEMLERGKIPTPDRIFEGDVFVHPQRLDLDFAGARLQKTDDGHYHLMLHDVRTHSACDLLFKPEFAPVRHGDDGVVRGPAGEDMFYYFIPRCQVSGTVTLKSQTMAVKHGQGWYDHEFGGLRREASNSESKREDIAWNWASVQFDDGHSLSAYSLVRVADNKTIYQWAILIDQGGERQSFKEMEFVPANNWRSTRTFYEYPTQWTLTVPEAGVRLRLDASFDDQEFVTTISKPAFWEGRCQVSGTVLGKAVTGLAYIERSGFESVHDLDEFFSAVGEEVRKSVANILPLEPTYEQARDLIATVGRDQYLDGLDIKQFARTLIKPIREIVDRGGKSWRSYAALACCDVVGGDSRKYVQWLAMPEMMHVGSLIVDDVQDKSTVRRGGPTCHMIYGEALAINAGTAAYFLTHRLLNSSEVSPSDKLRLYDLYFEVLRSGHAGQALDLDGNADKFLAAVESGESLPLERAILATHRLKAAAPAAALARMGAIAGGGSEAQIEAVGQFFEALGLAFQIIDDVLNLRGFKNDLKARGEDISNGTITLPVAKSMSRLSAADRTWLKEILHAKTKDQARILAAVEKLNSCGAIDDCAKQAAALVENAWQHAEPLLDDSIPKLMLRGFGWYVLERHY